MLVDKSYREILKFLRKLPPVKEQQGGLLSVSEERFDKRVASDHIIVENHFGCLITFGSVLSHIRK